MWLQIIQIDTSFLYYLKANAVFKFKIRRYVNGKQKEMILKC